MNGFIIVFFCSLSLFGLKEQVLNSIELSIDFTNNLIKKVLEEAFCPLLTQHG